MEKKGFRIEQYELAKPAAAVFDEVRYSAKGGLRVNYVIGTVKVDGLPGGKTAGDTPAKAGVCEAMEGVCEAMAGMRTVMVTWDYEGLCRRRSNGERMPEWDLKLEGDDLKMEG